MQKKETAIEVKVGALVIFSLALLVAFVIILGDISLDQGNVIYVDYDNAAGLKPGADVLISGMKAGQVKKLEFRGGKYDEEVGREVMVRAHLAIDKDMVEAIRTDSLFYITTQGVLGEKYVEVMTKNLDKPAVENGAKLIGVDPPRMELLLASAAEVLTEVADLIGSEDVPVGELIRNTNNLAKHADEILVENKDSVRTIMVNAETVSKDATDISAALKVGFGEGDDIAATLKHTRSLTAKVDRKADPVLNKTLSTLTKVESAAGSIDEITTAKRPQIEGSIDNIYETTEDFAASSDDVRAMVASIKAGKGSIGGLMNDEELYDDLKEMLRELKRRPWKIIWKE
jgi:phospholipid/cholesterol/gamma-HCH transport system substrate-binding protein